MDTSVFSPVERLVRGLPDMELRVFGVDRRAKVRLVYDLEIEYWAYHVTIFDPHAMFKLTAPHADFRIGGADDGERVYAPLRVELSQEVVTHIKPPGEPLWKATKWASTCLQKAGLFEPIFVLRAQDKLAYQTIEHWVELATASGCDSLKVRGAKKDLEAFDKWPTKKLPD